MNNLSRVFKKRGFISSVAAFLKTRPNAPKFCSAKTLSKSFIIPTLKFLKMVNLPRILKFN